MTIINDERLLLHGMNEATRAFNNRTLNPIKRFYADSFSLNERRKLAGIAALMGAVVRYAQILESAQIAGVLAINPAPPTVDELLYDLAIDPNVIQEKALLIMRTVQQVHIKGPQIRASLPAPTAADKPTSRAETPSAPLEVRIVEMPPRTTLTTIARNEAGEMVGSTAVETNG